MVTLLNEIKYKKWYSLKYQKLEEPERINKELIPIMVIYLMSALMLLLLFQI